MESHTAGGGTSSPSGASDRTASPRSGGDTWTPLVSRTPTPVFAGRSVASSQAANARDPNTQPFFATPAPRKRTASNGSRERSPRRLTHAPSSHSHFRDSVRSTGSCALDLGSASSVDSPLAGFSRMHLREDPAKFVFLGGSCDPTTWRKDIAIPRLQVGGITFYNPQMEDWQPEMIEMETNAKESCELLLFVIDGATRAIASMLEATEYIMRRRHVVLVIEPMSDGTKIDGELVKHRQLADLNRARAFLCDIAHRNRKHCAVFPTIPKALEYVVSAHEHFKEKGSRRRKSTNRRRSNYSNGSARGSSSRNNTQQLRKLSSSPSPMAYGSNALRRTPSTVSGSRTPSKMSGSPRYSKLPPPSPTLDV